MLDAVDLEGVQWQLRIGWAKEVREWSSERIKKTNESGRSPVKTLHFHKTPGSEPLRS